VLDLVSDKSSVIWDLRLARGLSYYTGCVFEVLPNDQRLDERFNIGSIGGGGRYDNLTGIFGMKDVAGVGVSFGLDRIMDTLAAIEKEEEVTNQNGILFCCMDKESLPLAVTLSRELRSFGLSAEIYPGAVKLKKQLDYANQRNKQWAVIIGESERESGELSVKNLVSGEQSKVVQSELKNHF
jgi:histidyl-tRNA synthetase